MKDVTNNSVALVVTSPPYFAGKDTNERLARVTYLRTMSSTCKCFTTYFSSACRSSNLGSHRSQRREPRS